AYYQLVLHPVEACANLNELYYDAAKNKLYAAQGRSATNIMADSVAALFKRDADISHYYNKVMSNGKWDHMMDQTHIGYTYWQQPRVDKIPNVIGIVLPAPPQMGVAVEGSPAWWPQEPSKAVLPGFYPGQSGHYIEVFNRGQGAFSFTAETSSPYITIQPKSGNVTTGQQIWVNVDWQKAPKGVNKVPITITAINGDKVTIEALVNKILPLNAKGFNENNGYISMEAAHYTQAINNTAAKWLVIPGYGRTLSGVMPSPVTAESQVPGGNSPRLEYDVNLIDTGVVNVEAYISPTIDFSSSSGLQYAISFDNEQPQFININADKSEAAWNSAVSDNIKIVVSKHCLSKPGRHILKYWMVSPGVVLQKIVINAGGEKPSYLGPPESYHTSN
ncbi:MAG TPA: glycosyl hydrolase, partial [Mucilaginibacter sp.]